MKIVAVLLSVMIAILAIGYIHFGGIHTVEVSEAEMGPFHLIYESQKGSYSQSGRKIEKLFNYARSMQVEPVSGFGIYLDNPQLVAESALRSDVGIIIEEKDLEKVQPLLDRYQYKNYPVTRALISEFPFKGYLSVLLGVMRVYPALMAEAASKNLAISYSFEIYETGKNKTKYAFPIVSAD